MSLYDKGRIKGSEQGFTVIELLVALSISMMIVGIIYGVFITGIKAYEKIGIEGQLRDEADYILSMVLNEIYELSPDTIESCGENCISFANKEIYKIDPTGDVSKELDRNADPISTAITIKIENDNLYINNQIINSQHISIRNNSESNLDTSLDKKLSFTCTRTLVEQNNNGDYFNICKSALIHLSLTLEHKQYTSESRLSVEPITLTSEFGF